MKKEIIWAPWRMGYILEFKKEGCFLCSAFKSKNLGKNYVIEKNKNAFVIMNIFPYNNGHLMVAPGRHIAEFERLTEEEFLSINLLIKKSIIVLKNVLKPEGFNIGVNIGKVSGAGVEFHIHFHIVPRWTGDTNFMPVISNTKVIPQALDDLYKKLKSEFKKG
jgi:ATP adenylyltransferase